jgi:uncharacterized protein (TIRG00374 family)
MNKIIDFLKQHRKSITNIITFVVFLVIALYLYKNRSVFANLKNLKVSIVLLIILGQVLTVFCNALLNQRIVNILQKDVPYLDSVLLQYTNNFLNKVLTKGGAIFRGYYLKKMYGLAYSRFASTLAGLYIIILLSYSFLGMVSLLLIYRRMHLFNLPIMIFFLLIFVITLFLIWKKPDIKLNREKRVQKLLGNMVDGWDDIRKKPSEVYLLFFITWVLLLITIFQTILIYEGLGTHLGFAEALYMSTINIITIFINITPDGIGIKEGVYVFSSELIGVDSDIILLGSLIGRALSMIPSIIIGGISYVWLIKKLKRNEGESINIKKIL